MYDLNTDRSGFNFRVVRRRSFTLYVMKSTSVFVQLCFTNKIHLNKNITNKNKRKEKHTRAREHKHTIY